MIRSVLLVASASMMLAVPTLAATVFTDDFSGDAPALNASLTNFNVAGQVDVVSAINGYGITTLGGNVVDLDGSSGPGEIISKLSYGFNAGDTITLGMLIGGAQRGQSADSLYTGVNFEDAIDIFDWTGFGYLNTFEGDVLSIGGLGLGVTSFASDNPFAWSGMSFRAGNAGILTFYIGTESADNVGPLLAGVSLDITPAPVPLPATGAVLLLGIGLLAGLRRKRG